MGNIGGPELLVILIVALLVLGPNRLPQAARSMGKAMAEFRRVTGGLQNEVRDAMSQLENELSVAPLDGPPENPPVPELPDRPHQLPGPPPAENA